MIAAFSPFSLPYGSLAAPGLDGLDLWLLPLEELAPPLALSLQADASPNSVAAQRLTRKMMLRLLLSAYLKTAPRDLRLGKMPGGKPFIVQPINSGLHFSVSHSLGYVLVAVSGVQQLGVDIEVLTRNVRAPLAVARRYFAPEEAETLAAVDHEGQQRRDFLRLWTRKEAVVKATGGGIVSGLNRFVVQDDAEYPELHSMMDDDATDWRLIHLEPAAGLVGTVAIGRAVQNINAYRVLAPGQNA